MTNVALSPQQEFLMSECWILAWNASVQRARLYKKGLKHPDTRIVTFRRQLIDYITDTLLPYYTSGCAEAQHLSNIRSLIAFANEVDPGILETQKYKYGVAQKLLNLALKYFWCGGIIEQPPHCPVDRIIIDKTKYRGQINWTQITEESEYLKIIDEVKRLADATSLQPAEWELQFYGRRSASNTPRHSDSA